MGKLLGFGPQLATPQQEESVLTGIASPGLCPLTREVTNGAGSPYKFPPTCSAQDIRLRLRYPEILTDPRPLGKNDMNCLLTTNVGSRKMTSTRILVAFALLVTVIGCQSSTDNAVPDHLLGVWKTSHPKYADRFFEIKNDALIFGQGGEKIKLHALADIENTRQGKQIFYTITHINHRGQRYKFSFYYDPTDGGTIRFKNQKQIVWTKERR